jgi:hypothetical protein
MTFEAYVGHCLAYAGQKSNGSAEVLDEWQMKVLEFGCYVRSLQRYYEVFPRDNIKVMFFEELKSDTAAFMRELSGFLAIDAGFWDDFAFHRENVTFQPRNALLQKMALWVNARGEVALRRRPALKRKLVGLYKSVNQSQEGYDEMPAQVRRQLDGFYAAPNRELRALLGRDLPTGWMT